jgi:thiamine monophosphate synthase
LLIVDALACGPRYSRALAAALGALEADHVAVRLRFSGVWGDDARELAQLARAMARRGHPRLAITAPPDLARSWGYAALHLPDRHGLGVGPARPPGFDLVLASAHDAPGLTRAAAAQVDAAVLGPVLPPNSKPGDGMGWTAFEALARATSLPVLALGGLTAAHVEEAAARGAAGVAVVGALAFDERPERAVSHLVARTARAWSGLPAAPVWR